MDDRQRSMVTHVGGLGMVILAVLLSPLVNTAPKPVDVIFMMLCPALLVAGITLGVTGKLPPRVPRRKLWS